MSLIDVIRVGKVREIKFAVEQLKKKYSMNHHNNIVRIKAVNNYLADLKDKVVFVGGATISLYADRQTLEIRPTDDIDVIIEIINYSERTKLEEKLRDLGFQHDIKSGIICRFKIQGIIVDIMPTEEASMGFKIFGIQKALKMLLNTKLTIIIK